MAGISDERGDDGAPTPEQIRACLGRILLSEPFRASPQLSAFLRFTVEETLAGRAEELKGYSIATLALGRPDSFDPQTDPIVRVQAGRLRQALGEFYAENPGEQVGISLQKGVYVPAFALRHAPRELIAAEIADIGPDSRPNVRRNLLLAVLGAVVLLVAAGTYLLRRPVGAPAAAVADHGRFMPSLRVEAAQATSNHPDMDELLSRTRDAIARFDDIVTVQGLEDAAAVPSPQTLPNTGQSLILRISGTEIEGARMRVNARLIDRANQTLVWSREYDPVAGGPAGDSARTLVLQSIATTVAQPYGVIHAYLRGRLDTGQIRGEPYGCLVSGFDYWRQNDRKSHGAARDCLLRRSAEFPTVGSLHAQLSYLHLEEFRQGYNPLPGNPLDRALLSARRAVELAPTSARSHQALLAAHFARGETDSAWRAAGEAMTLNPFDTEIIADVGARHVQSGHYVKGLGMLEQALALNPSPPIWAMTFRATALYLLGRLDEGAPIAAALQGSEYPPAMMALVLAARHFRDEASGKKVLADLKRIHPGIADEPAAYLKRLAFEEETAARIVRDYWTSRRWIESLP